MPITYNLLASQLPVPVGPKSVYLRSTCTDATSTDPIDNPFSNGMFGMDWTQQLNQLQASLVTMAAYPCGVFGVGLGLQLYTAYDNAYAYDAGQYASYSGVVYVCILASIGNLPSNATYWTATAYTPVTGLNIGVIPGVGIAVSTVEFAGGYNTLPDNTSIVYIWLKGSQWSQGNLSSGTLDHTTTAVPPGGYPISILLGTCNTLAGVISLIDYAGVIPSITGVRRTADRSAPADTPTADTAFLTKTQSGTFHWNGSAYNSLTPTSAGALNIKQTLTGDYTTLPQDNFHNVCLDPGGSNRVIYLPNPASVGNAWRISYTHIGSANTLVVKDYTGVTTYCTMTTTNRSLAVFTFTNSSGVVAFPAAGGWAPGPVPSPTAGAAI